jgi:hypothetical protein
MSSKLSVEQVLTALEKRLEHHQEQEAFHARQEAHHREQRELQAAEVEKVRQGLEAFRGVAPLAVDLAKPLASQPGLAAAAATEEVLPPSGRLMASRLVRLTVESAAEPFGPTAVTEEVNRRFADRLRKPIGPRMVSNVLRRMVAEEEIELVREGKPFQEALYNRVPR